MKKAVIGLMVFTLSFSTGVSFAQSRKLAAEMIQQSLLEAKTRQETSETLDPRLFSKNFYVSTTYQIAKEIPEVLDKIFCYCYCGINPKFKHKSLLSCYTDNHASQCGICMKEAVIAKQMTDKGKTPEQIALRVKKTYTQKGSR